MSEEAMHLSSYSKSLLAKRSQETGFARDSPEKVYRLVEILEYLNRSPLFRESLALKGGTAINLTIFNLPRLSVDIDMDYLKPIDRDSVLRPIRRDRACAASQVCRVLLRVGVEHVDCLLPDIKSR